MEKESCECSLKPRSFSHVIGNYPTFVYIPLRTQSSSNASDVIDLITELKEKVSPVQSKPTKMSKQKKNSTNSSINLEEGEPHISLSPCVPIKRLFIKPFVAMLRESLKSTERFEVEFNGETKIFFNENKTRKFFSLLVDNRGINEIRTLVSKISIVFSKFQLPTFSNLNTTSDDSNNYEPHISYAWSLTDPDKNSTEYGQIDRSKKPETKNKNKKRQRMNDDIQLNTDIDFNSPVSMVVDSIEVKIGAFVYRIDLSD